MQRDVAGEEGRQSWTLVMEGDKAARTQMWLGPLAGVSSGNMIRQDMRLETALCQCEVDQQCRAVALVRPGVFQSMASACLEECYSPACGGHRNWVRLQRSDCELIRSAGDRECELWGRCNCT